MKSAPLVEAIFEAKWQFRERQSGLGSDPHYSVLVGSLYHQIRGDYPVHQPLPTTAIPEEMAAGTAQHRFRVGQNQWPLIQLGPGIFTVNETSGYTWANFKEKVIQGVDALFEAHPNAQDLTVQQLLLRYINAVEFDFDQDNIFSFLRDKLKTDIRLHPPLFENNEITETPSGFDCQFTFECHKPASIIRLRLARGRNKEQNDIFIWETSLQTGADNVPDLPSRLENWLEEAHDVVEDWFFQMIEGDLKERFE